MMDLSHITDNGVLTAIVLVVTVFNSYQHLHTSKAILELKVWMLQHFVAKTDAKRECE